MAEFGVLVTGLLLILALCLILAPLKLFAIARLLGQILEELRALRLLLAPR